MLSFKNLFRPAVLVAALVFGHFATSNAQLRSEVPSPFGISGPTLAHPSDGMNDQRLFGLASLRMGHSYEMSMGSFGGQMYNQNMYTNTIMLDFNERMSGRLDVAFAHSPFGNALPGMNQSGRIFVRNAELNYNLSERTNINISFRQVPAGMGYYNPYGYNGFGHGHNPFGRSRYMYPY